MLAVLIEGPPTKNFKVQLNSFMRQVELSKYMQEEPLALLCKAWIYKGSGNIKGMT